MSGYREVIQRQPDHVRIGYAERERAAALLGEHLAAGRLDTDEFDERVQRVYAARTGGELEPLFADLPDTGAAARPQVETARRQFEVARIGLIVAALLACVVWVAVLRIPPFFVFPLFWIVALSRGGRWAHHRRS